MLHTVCQPNELSKISGRSSSQRLIVWLAAVASGVALRQVWGTPAWGTPAFSFAGSISEAPRPQGTS